MLNAGILPGDLVVVHSQPTAQHGEIVVALIDDEATVKRLSLKNGQVWLLPENEAYSPIDGTYARYWARWPPWCGAIERRGSAQRKGVMEIFHHAPLFSKSGGHVPEEWGLRRTSWGAGPSCSSWRSFSSARFSMRDT